ncbi:hypothetical protein Acr_21g0003490 [Actinidia rufa]|uniref:Retrovirus-related Pol polyprotein from transposon TNT 1-94-like beta-barrel domain-containing protein n=1 Tax=Actinidia rufa TaxID=165716 RepID=A0A7J0GFZ9_9ERIC|nr:hypothetical protein Acr_21g0003490 [Actinidia rufa]
MADPIKNVVPTPIAQATVVPSSVLRKTQWILGKELKLTESDPKFDEWDVNNCIILGWMFNLMKDRVYHMFMCHDTVHSLWIALNQMYAHAYNESRIFELHRDISHASQPIFGLFVADYFGYLQTRWEELAQYEPLSDFPNDGAVDLNTSPLPSLYEAFTTVDGDEQRHRLLLSHSLPESSQMAFAAPSGTRTYFAVVAMAGSHLGLAPSSSSGPMAAIAVGTLTALHSKSGHPTWILDSGANNHMTGELSIFNSPVTSVNQSVCIADGSSLPIHSQGDARLSSDITLFADLTLKKIFGWEYERDGLYYFKDPSPSSTLLSSLHVSTPQVLESSILVPLKMIKTQYNTVARNIRSDNGREYITNEFCAELNKNGMGVPKHFWYMVVLVATYLINQTPSWVLQGKAPLHILQPASILFIILPRVFGVNALFKTAVPLVPNLMTRPFVVSFLDLPSPGPISELFKKEDYLPPRLLPILESPPPSPSGSLSLIVTTDPSKVYSAICALKIPCQHLLQN